MPSMYYQGVIIEESLADTNVLQDLCIISTQVEPVTDEHRTPEVKQWTLHRVEIPPAFAPAIAYKISAVLRPDRWYADFKNDRTHFVIFPGKVFRVDRSDRAQYEEAVAYGARIGIPEYQLDFSPTVEPWGRQGERETGADG